MALANRLRKDYAWVKTPLIIGAPMRLISLAPLAVRISRAGGIGFIAAGTDVSTLETELISAQRLLEENQIPSQSGLPIGVGFINWGADQAVSISLLGRFKPAAAWFFAPRSVHDLVSWTEQTRTATPTTKVWVQVGCVKDAVEVARACKPDVLVVQGTDAGGHGLAQGAGIVSLLPEVADAIEALVKEGTVEETPLLMAAGGIVEGRGVAAALALGAAGVVMGTRFLASSEATIAAGYRGEVVKASDGGQNTVRTKVYDSLRGTTGWSQGYNARGVVNRSYVEALGGLDEEENKKLYEEALKKGDAGWGVDGRLATYAGAGVGLVKDVKKAGDIVEEVRANATGVLERLGKNSIGK
ncbi:putative oxidoreductase [Glonium stellatum]|uniref:Putative oxidoreductase n=1 Tax=Glonium stellatum TaxID=574774 RepID=A0A8E2F8B1_9PEZI|nr:putative oxidoreductase [Glonium stellatum]